jgi:hypothetical protein
MPRVRPSGPIRRASATTIGSQARRPASVPANGSARATRLRPQGMPAGATRTSRLARSGLRAASSAATRPPSEWPARSTRSSPAASSQRASHALSAAASTARPGRGRLTAYSRRRSDSVRSSGDHQRQEPASPCTSTSGSPLPITRWRTGRPSTSTSRSSVSTNCVRMTVSLRCTLLRCGSEAWADQRIESKGTIAVGPRSSVDRAAVS